MNAQLNVVDQGFSPEPELLMQVERLRSELTQARKDQQLQLEEKVRLAGRLTLLLEALPGGVVVLGGDGRAKECNPAAVELLGEPLQGEIWLDVVRRAFAPRPDDGHDISLTNGLRVNIETCSLGDEPGQILLLKDVTGTRRLQDQVAHLQRLSAMGNMAASLAHQVRTPVASALLYTSGLSNGRLGEEKRQHYTGKLKGVLQNLERLVNDMLSYAHTGSFQIEEVAVDELYRGLIEHLNVTAGSGRFASRGDNRTSGLRLQGNRDALLSAFQNMINNAAEVGGEGLLLELEVNSVGEDAVCFTIADNGPGIAEDIRARIFEPFVSGRSGGTGLGLAVVKAVVHAHGGSVKVDSSLGEGSLFTVELPLLKTGGDSVNATTGE